MFNQASNIVGWDIGGAHLKAVLLDAKGEVINCIQLPCPLWKGMQYLERAVLDALEALQIAPSRACHAITMTGEMVDLFENRHQGVCEIAKLVSKLLGEHCYFYAPDNHTDDSFVCAIDVPRFASVIASANWHASATFLAKHVPNALLIDIGSTTSDIIPIIGGRVALNGNSDVTRLKNDSLVYTGVVRTPIMALAQKLPFFDGESAMEINVMAELFATTADAYRLTGELTTDDAETADGKGKSQLESARRLARMIGHDVDKGLDNKQVEKWIKLAFACRNLQMQQIKTAMLKQLKPNMTIIGAGAGNFLVKQIAADLGYKYQQAWEQASRRFPEHHVFDKKHDLDVCFPAFAVASLLVNASLC